METDRAGLFKAKIHTDLFVFRMQLHRHNILWTGDRKHLLLLYECKLNLLGFGLMVGQNEDVTVSFHMWISMG